MPKNKIPRIHNEKLSLTMYKPVTQVAWGQRQEEFWSFPAA